MRTNNEWTNKEVRLLHEHYPSGGAVACQQRIPRSRGAIQNKARAEGIPGPKWTEGRCEPYEWDDAEDARIRALYAGARRKGDVSALALAMGVDPSALTDRARRLGVVTGPYWAQAQRRSGDPCAT